MIRYLLLLWVVLLSACGTIDSLSGFKSFRSFEGKPIVKYNNQRKLALWVNDQFVSIIEPIGRGADWTDTSRWEGSYNSSYLYVQCGEAHWQSAERQCDIKEIIKCQWDATRNSCAFHSSKKLIKSLNVGTPTFVFNRESPSFLTGVISSDDIVLSYQGKPLLTLPILGILVQDHKKRLYRGQFGSDVAEVACQDHQGGYNNYQAPTIVCSAFRDAKGSSGIGFDLAKIGEAVIPWNKSDYLAMRTLAEKFYVLDRWPRLNPNKPKEIPFASKSKSDYAKLLDQEWAAWKN